jgi:hypothetical protein
LLAVALPLLLVQGCPNSQIIENQIGNLAVGSSAQPNDIGRYEIAQLGLTQLELRPADPEAASSLEGADPIGALKDSPNLELNLTQQSLSGLALTAGEYYAEALVTFGFRLEDLDPPVVPQTCLENFAVLQQSIPLRLVDLDPSFRVRVPSQGGADMTIVVDSPGLIAALEDNYVCFTSPSACAGIGSPTTPCRAFLPGFGADDIAAFFSLE